MLTYIYHSSYHKNQANYVPQSLNDMVDPEKVTVFFLKGNESSSELINFRRFFVSFQS